MKKITVLGSTGSIGVQTLSIVRGGGFKVLALSAGKNIELLEKQVREFSPLYAVVAEESGAKELSDRIKDTSCKVLCGSDGVKYVAAISENDIVLNAIVGIAGLCGTISAVEAKNTVALANKESLVCAGELVMRMARENNVQILPVDSEHSAIFQAMQAGKKSEIEQLILTASGGPFFGKKDTELTHITAKDALKHPSWDMGAKITIDSATLMNKGFELIEAMHIFEIPPQKIDVVVHRESIIHSLVEFCDGNVLAQLSNPDMRLPIQYALTFPDRMVCEHKKLRLSKIGSMTFYEPDRNTFKALALCENAAERAGNAGAVINGANEVAVATFLRGEIGFLDIYSAVEYAYLKVEHVGTLTTDVVYQSDLLARKHVVEYLKNKKVGK